MGLNGGRVRTRRAAVQGVARCSDRVSEQAPQRCNAPFPFELFGQLREPAAYVVAAPCRRGYYVASPRLVVGRFSQLRASRSDP